MFDGDSGSGGVGVTLTPVLARAHYEQMARYFAEFGHMALQPGELVYLAVASDEPPGKPIITCRKVQVALELAAPEDPGPDSERLREAARGGFAGPNRAVDPAILDIWLERYPRDYRTGPAGRSGPVGSCAYPLFGLCGGRRFGRPRLFA